MGDNEFTVGPVGLEMNIFILTKVLYPEFLHYHRSPNLLPLCQNLCFISRKCWPQQRLNVTPEEESLARSLKHSATSLQKCFLSSSTKLYFSTECSKVVTVKEKKNPLSHLRKQLAHSSSSETPNHEMTRS